MYLGAKRRYINTLPFLSPICFPPSYATDQVTLQADLLSSVEQCRGLVDAVCHLSAVVNRLAAGTLLLRRKHRRRCNHRVRRNVMGLINRAGKWNGDGRRKSVSAVVMVVTVRRAVVWADADRARPAVERPRRRGHVAAGARRAVAARDQLDAGGGGRCARRRVRPRCQRHVRRCRHRRGAANWDALRTGQQRKRRVRRRRVRSRRVLPTQRHYVSRV